MAAPAHAIGSKRPFEADEPRKALAIKLSDGSDRNVGTFPTRLHTDIRTVILSIRRGIRKKGKPIHLSAERTAAVDAALRDGSEVGSIEGLRTALERWTKEGLLASADSINKYYNDERADNYTQHNAIAQKALSVRTWQLQRELPPTCADLVLDLGCGSGLSSATFESLGKHRVVGCDLSIAMLAHARRSGSAFDFVQADISRPLPFRDAAFSAALSVSTVQHLLQPAADGALPAERLGTLFHEVRRTVAPGRSVPRSLSLQFHVDGAPDARRIRDAAREAGVPCELIVDQPYASDSRRWFLTSASSSKVSGEWVGGARGGDSASISASALYEPSSEPSAAPGGPWPCALYWDSSDGCASCVLGLHAQLGPSSSLLGEEHAAWCTQEHVRAAHRWVRVLRRVMRLREGDASALASAEPGAASTVGASQLSTVQAAVAERLIKAYGLELELAALKADAAAVLELMHRPQQR